MLLYGILNIDDFPYRTFGSTRFLQAKKACYEKKACS